MLPLNDVKSRVTCDRFVTATISHIVHEHLHLLDDQEQGYAPLLLHF